MNSFKDSKERLISFLKANGIKDERVLDAFRIIPRHLFVPEILKYDAYKNSALPIGQGQTISQPLTVAYMTQELELEKNHYVLEIGTGSGFQTAILSVLSEKVFTVEKIKDFVSRARKVHEKLNLFNIVYRVGDGVYGWREFSPYDRIIVTAAFDKIPDTLISQLKDGGILISPIKYGNGQRLLKLIKTENGLHENFIGECNFVEIV